MQRKRYLVIALITAIAVPVLIILALTAANYPPVVESLLAQPDRVFPSGSAQVVCIVSAPDGAVLSYEWEASGGEIDGAGASVTWTARVSDGAGNWVRQSIEFDVVDCEACVVW